MPTVGHDGSWLEFEDVLLTQEGDYAVCWWAGAAAPGHFSRLFEAERAVAFAVRVKGQ